MATRSIGASVAEGIESGFGLGLRADEAARRKKADARAEQDQLLQRERGDRAERRLDRQERISDLGERTKRLEARRGELVAASQAAQAAGGSVDPGAAAEFASVNKTLAQLRQEGENFFSRAATGQVDPLKASPEDLYTHLTAATGMTPAQIRQSTKHIADVTAGLQTSNEGLVIQGVNGLMQPQLNRGVGEASPHGGKILRKEVIGLDPAVDANMQPIPGKFMPRLRVYVQMPGMMTDKPLYYDAPMTVDGSSEGGAQVAVIDVKNGMNFMGNLGTLATAISRPDVLAKLEEGEKLAGARMKAALAELTAVSRPKAKGAAAERLDVIEAFARKNGIADLGEAAKRLQGMGVLANVGVLGQKLAAIDALDPDDPDYVLKRDVLLGGGGKTTGLIPQKPGKAGAAGSETMSSRYGKDPEYTKQVNYWAQLKANGGEWPARFSQIVGQEMASDVFKATAGIGVPNDQIANAADVQGLKAGARAA
ncbi:MAG: hypothetical protein RLZZ182_2227, partial [Pseudomonadota bacterium]